jgi:hypothetical protein
VDVGDRVEGPGETIDRGGVGALPGRVCVDGDLIARQQYVRTEVGYAIRAAADVQAAAGRDEGKVDGDEVRVVAVIACYYGDAAVEIGYRGMEPD